MGQVLTLAAQIIFPKLALSQDTKHLVHGCTRAPSQITRVVGGHSCITATQILRFYPGCMQRIRRIEHAKSLGP
jgi:hypothetical protein